MGDTRADAEMRIEGIYGTAALDRLRKEQREKLLPQIAKKRARVQAKAEAIAAELQELDVAEREIRAGHITTWSPRKRTATPASEKSEESPQS